MTTSQQWEYARLTIMTNDMATLDKSLQQLGEAGFELCGWASVDKTVGFNGFVAIFKRPGLKLPGPAGKKEGKTADAGWFPDPYGVHEHRFWSGYFWTEAVADAGEPAVHVPGS